MNMSLTIVEVCPSEVPTVPHASGVKVGADITYTCDNAYAFDDDTTVKTVSCQCAKITKLAGCHSM